MMRPSPANPLGYMVARQYQEHPLLKRTVFKQRLAYARNLFRKDLFAHYGCVNAIEFSRNGDFLVSGGDDRRVLLWSIRDTLYGPGHPVAMETNHVSNIFCLAFNSDHSRIFSGGNDDTVVMHDVMTTVLVGQLPHKKPVYGISVSPDNDFILATAGDDGRVLLFDIREPQNSNVVCLSKQQSCFHSVMFNPTNARLLATANSEDGIALWDCRKPRDVLIHYDSTLGPVSGLSARFNSTGSKLLALRRRLPPVLYNTRGKHSICQFYHPLYYNSCTMKTCCFAGEDDEYVLSGSDDFNMYMWKVPSSKSVEWGTFHMVLRGHRSIVNQVRYNNQNSLIASSGVEKMVKLWTTAPIGTWSGSLNKDANDAARHVYSHEDYFLLVGHSGERISHDYSDLSTQEDAKMIAFFDSLVQREIEGWDSLPTSSSESNVGRRNSVLDAMSGISSSSGEMSDSHYTMHLHESVNMLVNKMFHRNTSTPFKWNNMLEWNKQISSDKCNRITQLIARKRLCLARMAHRKSSGWQMLRHKQKQRMLRHLAVSRAKIQVQRRGNFVKMQSSRRTNGHTERGNSKRKKSMTIQLRSKDTRANKHKRLKYTSNSKDYSPPPQSQPSTSTPLKRNSVRKRSIQYTNGKNSDVVPKRRRSHATVASQNNTVPLKCEDIRESSVERFSQTLNGNSKEDNILPTDNCDWFDAPSTSTGVRSSSSLLYRVFDGEDSDDDTSSAPTPEIAAEEQNVADNILGITPTPLNGTTHELLLNVLTSNGTISPERSPLGIASHRSENPTDSQMGGRESFSFSLSRPSARIRNASTSSESSFSSASSLLSASSSPMTSRSSSPHPSSSQSTPYRSPISSPAFLTSTTKDDIFSDNYSDESVLSKCDLSPNTSKFSRVEERTPMKVKRKKSTLEERDTMSDTKAHVNLQKKQGQRIGRTYRRGCDIYSSSDEDSSCANKVPVTPDSGCVTGACSSSSPFTSSSLTEGGSSSGSIGSVPIARSADQRGANHCYPQTALESCSNDDENDDGDDEDKGTHPLAYETFSKRIIRARKNIRRRFDADLLNTDSN